VRTARWLLLGLAIVVCRPALGAERSWYTAPTLGIRTGFIKDPQGPLTLLVWREGLGSQFDADRWVRDFKDAGASYLVFCDKWLDGLVNHDTKTTPYKTRRDFVRDIAAACQRGGLRLVLYTNAQIDGNPDFRRWAVRSPRNWFYLYSEEWPFESQSLHSPFRRIAVDQARELFTGYGRVDGLWLDAFDQRLDTRTECVLQAYEKMCGEPFAKASPERLDEFRLRTLADYLDEARGIARPQQPECVFAANGAASQLVGGGRWAKWVGARLDYGSVEGQSFDRMDGLAHLASVSPKPVEIGTLLSKTQFAPNEDTPPPARTSPKQAIAEAAVAVCQGASVCMTLAPSHAGTFGDDLAAAKAVGAWFRKAEPVLKGAHPHADVAIVLGSPSPDGPGLPLDASMWEHAPAATAGAVDEAALMAIGLERAGLAAEFLCALDGGGNWPESLARYLAIAVPDLALLDDARVKQLAQYVQEGGRLVAFGHASMLDEHGAKRKDYALADVLGARYRDEAAVTAATWRVTVQADSLWGGGGEFPAANVLDEKPTFWASADSPMPHWVQVNMPTAIDVGRVELVSREGGYLVTDFDVEVPEGKDWKAVKSVRGAKSQTASAPLDRPVSASQIRVRILKEQVGGRDRQIADVEAIRIFDTAGRNRATEQELRVPVAFKTPAAKEAFGAAAVTFAPVVVRVRTKGAETLAELDTRGGPAALLRNQFGKGQAILVTTSGAAMGDDPAFWSGLARLLGVSPTVRCSDPSRYRIILNRVGGGYVLHAIDRRAGSPPGDVTISLTAERIGSPKTAALVGDGRAVELKQADGLLTLTLQPDPVASVLLR